MDVNSQRQAVQLVEQTIAETQQLLLQAKAQAQARAAAQAHVLLLQQQKQREEEETRAAAAAAQAHALALAEEEAAQALLLQRQQQVQVLAAAEAEVEALQACREATLRANELANSYTPSTEDAFHLSMDLEHEVEVEVEVRDVKRSRGRSQSVVDACTPVTQEPSTAFQSPATTFSVPYGNAAPAVAKSVVVDDATAGGKNKNKGKGKKKSASQQPPTPPHTQHQVTAMLLKYCPIIHNILLTTTTALHPQCGRPDQVGALAACPRGSVTPAVISSHRCKTESACSTAETGPEASDSGGRCGNCDAY